MTPTTKFAILCGRRIGKSLAVFNAMKNQKNFAKTIREITNQQYKENTMETVRPAKVGAGPRWEPLLQTKNFFYGDIALGNGTQWRFGIFRTYNGELFVGVEGKGAWCFQSEVKPQYVNEKLGLKSLPDAANLTDLINNELGCSDRSEQGNYVFQYCRP